MRLRKMLGLFVGVILSSLLIVVQVQAAQDQSIDGGMEASNISSSQNEDPRDPWEGMNRQFFSFNEVLDEYILRPVAVGYKKVTPKFLNEGITNVFSNVSEVSTLLNSILQWKGRAAARSAARFMFNTTFGLLGFFDVGTAFDIPRGDEDFSQTLGVWGVPSGPYIVFPFLGPHTVRRAVGRVFDSEFTTASMFITTDTESFLVFNGIKAIDLRASFLSGESFIVGDKYTFVRNGYLQRRSFLTKDGKVDDPFSDGGSDSLEDLDF